jgi:hypothetical protein
MLMLAVLTITAILGCDGDSTWGPCVHEYREPIVQITDARDMRSGAAVDSIVLTHIRIDGRVVEPLYFATVGPSYGVSARGDSLFCQIPCGFATAAGNYVFTVSAPGYLPQDRGYDAQYGVFKGGCPSYNDEGLRVSLRLWHG